MVRAYDSWKQQKKNNFLNQKPFKKQKIEEIFFSVYFLNQGFR